MVVAGQIIAIDEYRLSLINLMNGKQNQIYKLKLVGDSWV